MDAQMICFAEVQPPIDPDQTTADVDQFGWGTGFGVLVMVLVSLWIRGVTKSERRK
jgi:hypothetical protein